MLYEEIGERIRGLRGSAGLSQEALGDKVGLTRTSITNLEKGRQQVPLHTLYEIAGELSVPLQSLLPEQMPRDVYEEHVEVMRAKFVGAAGPR